MIFCGQCGSQLVPGTTHCPYCGAVSQGPEEVLTKETYDVTHADAPTVESNVFGQVAPTAYATNSTKLSSSFTPPEQHKLVLHSDDVYDYGNQSGSEPTSALRPANYSTHPSAERNASNSGVPSSPYSTFAPQTNYPSTTPAQQAPGYQSYQDIPGSMNNYGAVATPQQYPQYQSPPPSQPARKQRSRVPLLLTVLLLLVVILGSLVFYALRHAQVANTGTGGTGAATGTTTTAPMTPGDHAKAVVHQYYNDINNKNYHEAYYLWLRDGNSQTYSSFTHGYANTVHDDLTITNVVDSGGTVRVTMTIVATERIKGRDIQHTYGGYYLVQQVSGTWKIVRGYLAQVR